MIRISPAGLRSPRRCRRRGRCARRARSARPSGRGSADPRGGARPCTSSPACSVRCPDGYSGRRNPSIRICAAYSDSATGSSSGWTRLNATPARIGRHEPFEAEAIWANAAGAGSAQPLHLEAHGHVGSAASAAGVAHRRSARWRASASVRSARRAARCRAARRRAALPRSRQVGRVDRHAAAPATPRRQAARDDVSSRSVWPHGAARDLGEHVARLAAVRRAELVERGEEVVVARLDAVAEALHRPGAQNLVVGDVVAERVAERPLAGGARPGLREQRDHVHADAAGRAAADHRLRVHGARQVVVQVAALGHVVEERVALHLVAAVALQVLGRSQLGRGSRRGEQREQENMRS